MYFSSERGQASVLDLSPPHPPLGNALYSALEGFSPNTWGRLPQSIVSAFAKGFEQGMEMIWNRNDHSIPTLMREMGRYFTRFSPTSPPRNDYSELLTGLITSGKLLDSCFSTLNYECPA